MEGDSEGRWPALLKNLFKKNGHALEEHILEAKHDGEIKGEEVSMLLNVLELDDTEVSEIMVPRPDMVCADEQSTLAGVSRIIVDNGHSRIPLYRETKDRIVGIIHAKDLLSPLLDGDGRDGPVRGFMRQPLFVPDYTPVRELLRLFQAKRVHLAIAQDEYGGTSGLVTLEDVLEEIVGEIEDEYDIDRPRDILEQEDGSLLVSGRAYLEDLEPLGIRLDSEQVDSLGGYLTQQAGCIPAEGESFRLEGRRFTVQEADVKNVRLVRIDPPEKTRD